MVGRLDRRQLAGVEVRRMREDDLEAVASTLNLAFSAVIESIYGRKVLPPLFSPLLGPYRLAADAAGCHVATSDGQIVGANFSVARGSIGWFGPLAVTPEAQGKGISQLLVDECIRSWTERGVRMMGLETFPSSPLHINLYSKFGFRPSWTGVAFRREIGAPDWPDGIDVDAPVPNLDYLYPGYDPSQEVIATTSTKVGITLVSGGGCAICHIENTLWNDAKTVYLPLLIAPDRNTFDRLLAAVENVARQHGKSAVATQVPGSSWVTQQALSEHGYKAGTASLRMKRGEQLDYDAGSAFCCDDWH